MSKGVVNIHGKKYKMVGLRVAEFRQKFSPSDGWAIKTELLANDTERSIAVVKASIVDPAGRVVATGIAQDAKGDSSRHTTSWVEIAETSAIGRALGTFSAETMGDEYNIASAEEVQNAMQAEKERAEKKQKEILERKAVNAALRAAAEFFKNPETGEIEVDDYVSTDLVRSKDLNDRKAALETLMNVLDLQAQNNDEDALLALQAAKMQMEKLND